MTDVSLYDYELPESLMAHVPAEKRDESRLLHLNRRTGEVSHLGFRDVQTLLGPGNLLILNDARVIPARLRTRRATGGRVEVLLVRPEDGDATGLATGRWLAMVSAGGRLREGETLTLEGTGARLCLIERRESGYWLLEPDEVDLQEVLSAGEMPLPPYVRRARERRGLPASIPQFDADRYQTVFARRDGAVAAPTAGLHFTPELLARLAETGVEVRTLSLMVGPGTFRPVKAQRIEDHAIEPERYHLPGETAAAVRSAIESGRRIVATGTTVCRVLEYVARRGEWTEHSGWTDLFIRPPFEFRAVGALITNFHLPRSTLLMLVCAFAGREAVVTAYRDAVARAYRFYSYGDAMLIG